jgi:hypothetical protein
MPSHRNTELDQLRGSIDPSSSALPLEPMHGWGIGARIRRCPEDARRQSGSFTRRFSGSSIAVTSKRPADDREQPPRAIT